MTTIAPGTSDAGQAAPELTITRRFPAPAALVFRAWTQAENLARWLGPRDHPAREVEVDFRVRGRWRACLQAPGGDEIWVGGEYREISPPDRLTLTFAWESTGYESLVTIRLEEIGEQTIMHFHQAPFTSVESRDSHNEGWSSSFDRLGDLMAAAAVR